MSDSVIRVENLGKKYIIGHEKQERYTALRDVMANSAKGLVKSFQRGKSPELDPSSEEFWALKDVSFEIKQGERVGIIGRNGAGKSTLLKILSRITEPTKGRIGIKGRVASLLEVGTGFHPELTGRENIFLNGAILGMGREEIRRKFDEIVAFAEVERFLDTPVKRYSSGMYVRLAFAVAAHLEPEILIIDEVLAVGDADFQKRCLGKMEDVAEKEGRTVIFVSHSMPMISSLCNRCLLLKQGEIIKDDTPGSVIMSYQNGGQNSPAAVNYEQSPHPPGDSLATLKKAWVENAKGEQCLEIRIDESAKVWMVYQVKEKTRLPPYPNFHFYDEQGNCAFVSAADIDFDRPIDPGLYSAYCEIPSNFLNDGLFSVGLALTFTHSGTHVSFYDRDALMFNVTDPIEGVPTRSQGYVGPFPGIIRPILNWGVEKIS
jgi:lipopolysaccharide transport system ATP-binding protein